MAFEDPTVRLPAVAGQFYTDNATVLSDQIRQFLMQAPSEGSQAPKAIIAPHAGYIYSGPVAATAYKTLEPVSDNISRVVIMSPAHRYGFRGIAWSADQNFHVRPPDFEFVDVDRDGCLDLFMGLCTGYAVFRQTKLELQGDEGPGGPTA